MSTFYRVYHKNDNDGNSVVINLDQITAITETRATGGKLVFAEILLADRRQFRVEGEEIVKFLREAARLDP